MADQSTKAKRYFIKELQLQLIERNYRWCSIWKSLFLLFVGIGFPQLFIDKGIGFVTLALSTGLALGWYLTTKHHKELIQQIATQELEK